MTNNPKKKETNVYGKETWSSDWKQWWGAFFAHACRSDLVDILKRQLANKFTMQSVYNGDFWEFLPMRSIRHSQKSAHYQSHYVKQLQRWLLRICTSQPLVILDLHLVEPEQKRLFFNFFLHLYYVSCSWFLIWTLLIQYRLGFSFFFLTLCMYMGIYRCMNMCVHARLRIRISMCMSMCIYISVTHQRTSKKYRSIMLCSKHSNIQKQKVSCVPFESTYPLWTRKSGRRSHGAAVKSILLQPKGALLSFRLLPLGPPAHACIYTCIYIYIHINLYVYRYM